MSDENTAEKQKKQPEDHETQPTPEKSETTGQLIEAGHIFAKKRAEIEQERRKPGEETLEDQQEAAKAAFDQSIEEEVRAMEKEEELETGEDISEEEVKAINETIHEVFKNMSPELAKYMQNLGPRLDHLIDETSQLRQAGNDKDALEKLIRFLEDEDKYIENNVNNTELKEIMQSYIRGVLNAEGIVEEMEAQTKKELKSDIVDLVPVIGPMKMLRESAKGVTAGGEILDVSDRAWHAAKATGSLVLDGVAVAGLLTGGTVSAAAEGAKVAASGGKIATIATRFGAEGIEVAAAVKKFAALTRKTTKMTKAARTIYKCGTMIGKYPKLTASITKLIGKREQLIAIYGKNKTTKEFSKKYGNTGNAPTVNPANDNNLPEAPSKAA